jgi:hypothetical protein
VRSSVLPAATVAGWTPMAYTHFASWRQFTLARFLPRWHQDLQLDCTLTWLNTAHFLWIVGQKVGVPPLTRADSLSRARYLALCSWQVVKAGTERCEKRRCSGQEAATIACGVNQVALKKSWTLSLQAVCFGRLLYKLGYRNTKNNCGCYTFLLKN